MCQKASIQHSSQPRSNDPCVDPCVVLRLTLPLFPVLDNQSIVCLSVSLPLFRSFPVIWFSFSLVCILLFPLSVSLSLSLISSFAVCISVFYSLSPSSAKCCKRFNVMRIGIKVALIHYLTYHAAMILLGEECPFQTWQLSHWLCCSKVVVSTVLWLRLHLCYIASVAGQSR